jgi:hypothetical protein
MRQKSAHVTSKRTFHFNNFKMWGMQNPAAKHYYMIDFIQLPLPYVPIDDYSHIMVGDEVMTVEIIIESVVMMKTKKSSYPE